MQHYILWLCVFYLLCNKRLSTIFNNIKFHTKSKIKSHGHWIDHLFKCYIRQQRILKTKSRFILSSRTHKQTQLYADNILWNHQIYLSKHAHAHAHTQCVRVCVCVSTWMCWLLCACACRRTVQRTNGL